MALLFRRDDHQTRAGQHLPAQEAVVHPLQPQVPNDRHEHSDRFDYVWNLPAVTLRGHPRPQQIVEAENVHDIKIPQLRSHISPQPGIPGRGPEMKPVRQINDLHSPNFSHAAVRTPPRRRFLWHLPQALLQPPIRRQHAYLVASLRQAVGKGAHFNRRAAKLKKGRVALRDVQDSHSSRRIFLKFLAKTLNRNSFCTRSRPRSPICFANSGLASSASTEVASCATSPCWTTYPVFPS